MRLAALFSGGKDSTYAIYMAQNLNHQVECLLSISPKSESSMLLHYPNMNITSLQADLIGLPHLHVLSDSDDTDEQLVSLESLLTQAKRDYDIQGIVHGGIKSEFQLCRFKSVCSKVGLEVISPLWGLPAYQYMQDLISHGFVFIITSVSADGLDQRWLGKKISFTDLDDLMILSKKFGFNLNFEGGEAETLVLDCPLFCRSIKVSCSKTHWDGYRGRFEILDTCTTNNA